MKSIVSRPPTKPFFAEYFLELSAVPCSHIELEDNTADCERENSRNFPQTILPPLGERLIVVYIEHSDGYAFEQCDVTIYSMLIFSMWFVWARKEC